MQPGDGDLAIEAGAGLGALLVRVQGEGTPYAVGPPKEWWQTAVMFRRAAIHFGLTARSPVHVLRVRGTYPGLDRAGGLPRLHTPDDRQRLPVRGRDRLPAEIN